MATLRIALVHGHAGGQPGCSRRHGAFFVAATAVACISSSPGASGQAIDVESCRRSLDVFNGTYTIVNKADGRRIVASPEAGFSVVEGGLWPILTDQMWNFVPADLPGVPAARQPRPGGDRSYTIVNAASGVRLFAKSGADWDREFGALDNGPVYQDQRWWLAVQADGSFGIVNAKNGRRITSAAPAGIAAVAATHVGAPFGEDQRWWLINQQQAVACAADEEQAVACAAGSTGSRCCPRVNQQQAAACAADEEQVAVACAADEEQAQLIAPLSWLVRRPLAAFAAVIATTGLTMLWVFHTVSKLRAQLGRKQLRIDALEIEFREELNGMVRIGDAAAGDLGFDFGFRILDREVGQETVRLIKIQCPGVEHADVEVELIFNGCVVSLRRRASCGVEAATWRRRFQFRPSDGLFELKEDQMSLERGYLQLFFRAYRFQSRVIRFPQHFSLADSDSDQHWDYPVYSEHHPGPALELRRPDTAQAVAPGSGEGSVVAAPPAGAAAVGTPAAPAFAAAAAEEAAGAAAAELGTGAAGAAEAVDGEEDEVSGAASVDVAGMQAAPPGKTSSHLADTESTASTAR